MAKSQSDGDREEPKKDTGNDKTGKEDSAKSGSRSLADELGIESLAEPIFGQKGRFFSAAGRESPVAEFTEDFLVLHPPQRPLDDDEDEAKSEVIVIQMDDDGVLINEIGQRKKVPGARFNGKDIFYFWEQKPGTLKHFGVWLDDKNVHHFLVIEGERLTTDVIFQLRNMTHDGELGIFKEIEIE